MKSDLPLKFDPDCAFCAIAQGADTSVETVCEAETWMAFFPLNPATRGHTLVIPRTHVADLWQVEPPLDADLAGTVIRVGRAIDEALHSEGLNLIASAGATAEQTVFHLHLHVVPRWRADGFGAIWPPGDRYENADLSAAAVRIRAACDGL